MKEWGFKVEYDLDKMIIDMLVKLKKKFIVELVMN